MSIEIKYEKLKLNNLDEIYFTISEKLYLYKYVDNKELLISQLKERDEKGDNYIGNGIFLPHIKSKNILKTVIYVVVLEKNINYIDTIIFILANDKTYCNDYKEIIDFVQKLDDIEIITEIKEGRYGN